MDQGFETIMIEVPESSRYVAYGQSAATSRFVNYGTGNSLIPSSFDQIMKNGTIYFDAAAQQGHVSEMAVEAIAAIAPACP